MAIIIGSVLIEKNGKYLLVNAKVGAPKGLWNNPGGHKNEEESIEESAAREAKEETGYNVQVGRLLGIYYYEDVVKYIFYARIIDGELELPPDEIEEAGWFSADQVKKLENVTYGALQSILDYNDGKFNQTHYTNTIP